MAALGFDFAVGSRAFLMLLFPFCFKGAINIIEVQSISRGGRKRKSEFVLNNEVA